MTEHSGTSAVSPLYPYERTSNAAIRMSVKCQKATSQTRL